MQGTPSGPSLWLSLIRTFEAVDRVARRSMDDVGLGYSDFALLEALLHLGPQTPSVLADKIGLTSGSITAALDRLGGRGLVSRRSNPADQRSRIVELTPDGVALIRPAYERHAADLEALIGGVYSAGQRRELFDLLGVLRKAAQEGVR